jgi:hypothetical protein
MSEGVGLSSSVSSLDISQFMGKVTEAIVNTNSRAKDKKAWHQEEGDGEYYQLV